MDILTVLLIGISSFILGMFADHYEFIIKPARRKAMKWVIVDGVICKRRV